MSASAAQPTPTAHVYIDGFNLCHACFDDLTGWAQWRQYRWLDLGTLCAKLFPHHRISRIRYFTALVDPLPNNPDNRARQLEYLRALRTIPHAIKPRPLAPLRMSYVVEREENGSDVNCV